MKVEIVSLLILVLPVLYSCVNQPVKEGCAYCIDSVNGNDSNI